MRAKDCTPAELAIFELAAIRPENAREIVTYEDLENKEYVIYIYPYCGEMLTHRLKKEDLRKLIDQAYEIQNELINENQKGN